MATIIIGIALAGAVVLALIVMKRRKGKGSACSSCEGCSSASACRRMGGLGSDCSHLD